MSSTPFDKRKWAAEHYESLAIDAIFNSLTIVKKSTTPSIAQTLYSSQVYKEEPRELSKEYTIINNFPYASHLPEHTVFDLLTTWPKDVPYYYEIPIEDEDEYSDMPIMAEVSDDIAINKPAKRLIDAVDEEIKLVKRRRIGTEPVLVIIGGKDELTTDETKMTPYQRYAPNLRNMDPEPIKEHFQDISNILENQTGAVIKDATIDTIRDKLVAGAKVPANVKEEYYRGDVIMITDENSIKMHIIDLIVNNLTPENVKAITEPSIEQIVDHINMAIQTIAQKFAQPAPPEQPPAPQVGPSNEPSSVPANTPVAILS